MHVGAAKLLGGHVLPGGGLHERRPADEDRAGSLDDDRLVAHCRYVGTAGGAGAHHRGDLRDALGREPRLVEEDASEVVTVGEHLGLQGQKRSARVDEIDAGQAVLGGDLLRTEVLLDRQRKVRPALDRRVVRDYDTLPPLDHADAGDDSGRGRLSPVHVPGGQGRELEEDAAGIDEPVDPLARCQLAAGAMALDRFLATAERDAGRTLTELGHELLHPGPPAFVLLAQLHVRLENGHWLSLSWPRAPSMCPWTMLRLTQPILALPSQRGAGR